MIHQSRRWFLLKLYICLMLNRLEPFEDSYDANNLCLPEPRIGCDGDLLSKNRSHWRTDSMDRGVRQVCLKPWFSILEAPLPGQVIHSLQHLHHYHLVDKGLYIFSPHHNPARLVFETPCLLRSKQKLIKVEQFAYNQTALCRKARFKCRAQYKNPNSFHYSTSLPDFSFICKISVTT